MQENKINILSTRPLEQSLIDTALAGGAIIDARSFIETEAIVNHLVRETIASLIHEPIIAVFTSMNAVDAVAGYIKGKKTGWKIFCIGYATQKSVKENFGQDTIAGVADSAMALADVIIAHGNISSVIFFCGDRRRDELPGRLSKYRITVNELAVYKTNATAERISKQYDGIIFFSPSAVHSFFSVNTLPPQTILFAIGQTTAETLKTYTGNTVIIAELPGRELLVQQALAYFRANPVHH